MKAAAPGETAAGNGKNRHPAACSSERRDDAARFRVASREWGHGGQANSGAPAVPNLIHKVMAAFSLLRKGEAGEVWQTIKKQLFSDSIPYGFHRDLEVPFDPPAPRIRLHVRPLRPDDVPALFDPSGLSGEAARELASRRLLLEKGPPGCWVAADHRDTACYMQWLFSSAENEAVARYFKGLFPPLAPDEALLEYVYTVKSRRGIGVMPWAMASIAERAASLGARRVITFTAARNFASLKGCLAAGFVPWAIRRERWRLFRRTVTFAALPAGATIPLVPSGGRSDRL